MDKRKKLRGNENKEVKKSVKFEILIPLDRKYDIEIFSLVLVIKTSDIIVIVCRKLLITKIYGGCFVWLIFAPDTPLYTLHYSWTGLVLTGNNGQQQATTRYQDAKVLRVRLDLDIIGRLGPYGPYWTPPPPRFLIFSSDCKSVRV